MDYRNIAITKVTALSRFGSADFYPYNYTIIITGVVAASDFKIIQYLRKGYIIRIIFLNVLRIYRTTFPVLKQEGRVATPYDSSP